MLEQGFTHIRYLKWFFVETEGSDDLTYDETMCEKVKRIKKNH